jgi:hypothetical protein
MDTSEFASAVEAFADKPLDVDYDRGTLVAEVHDEIFELSLHERYGSLFCVEDGVEFSAGKWLIERLGRFELLAQRILDHIPEDPLFVRVEADMVDVLEEDPDADSAHTNDALNSLRELVGSELAGITKVAYLTSEAGEGKTSLIEQLARLQAQRYLDGEDGWLLLPIQLGGRPFIRLDDIIVGTLSNRLRFLYYYRESVVELVKLNALVLALDGFEEMFVQTNTGEAVSSLGNLVSDLDSRGRLLVAARSAYYNYRDFEAQAKLFQSIREADVSFAEVALRQWSRDQFLEVAREAGIEAEGKELYDTIAGRLSTNHPLLTRAVLARRLIEEYERSDDRDDLIRELSQASGEQYFDEFVSRLIRREAKEKWIDRSGEPAQPLLSVDGHHAILTAIAEEMWRSGADALSGRYLEEITELIVDEALDKKPLVMRQARERITQHALLVQEEGTNRYRFDHEHFQSYYIGRHLAGLLLKGKNAELRSMLEVKNLLDLAIRVCVSRYLAEGDEEAPQAVARLCELSRTGRQASFLRANAGRLVTELIGAAQLGQSIEVHSLFIRTDQTKGVRLENVTFADCTFEEFVVDPENQKNVRFEDCNVVHFVLPESISSEVSISMDENSLPSQASISASLEDTQERENHFYDPDAVAELLANKGVRIAEWEAEETTSPSVSEIDEEVKIVDRVGRYYQRSTSINENVFKQNLGSWWHNFENTVLPDLLDIGVLTGVPYRGQGQQRRFKLEASFERLEKARRRCDGDYDRLLRLLREEQI